MYSNSSCDNCKYSKVKASSVSMSGGKLNQLGYYNQSDISTNKNIDNFSDYTMSESYYSSNPNKNVGYNYNYNNTLLNVFGYANTNGYKGEVYEYNSNNQNYKKYLENFENKSDDINMYNKGMNYEIGFNGKLGFSEILYNNNQNNLECNSISNFANKSNVNNIKTLKCDCVNVNKNKNVKPKKSNVKENFGSYFMDNSYYTPDKEFGFN
jgi:hypothetical protein